MNPEFWAIIGVGIALAGLQWRSFAIINARVDCLETCMERIEGNLKSIKERLSRIAGWVAGRFGEEAVPST